MAAGRDQLPQERYQPPQTGSTDDEARPDIAGFESQVFIHPSDLYPVVAGVGAAVVKPHQDGLAAETAIAFQVQAEVEGPEPAGGSRKEAQSAAGEALPLQTQQSVAGGKARRLSGHGSTLRRPGIAFRNAS
jgi:hypothetical protein